ncbi:MAG TPA: NADH:flavin oxidoreductase [Terriglobia bacterium]|nr:NADH:flavin oxidoreductase [Terriglobia bacterium]
MPAASYPRIASFRTARAVADHLETLGYSLPADDEIQPAPASPLAQALKLPTQDERASQRIVGNRFAAQPMEGWDGEPDGRPSELTRRRWLRMATGGAKLMWGCEAVAVLPEARANPNQLVLNPSTARDLGALREDVADAHRRRFGTADDLVIGLQLTHSGRFCRPNEKTRLEPAIAYRHPILDARYPAAAECEPLSDGAVESIVRAFADAARLARECGFDFVDLKHCHGYLGHEFLGAHHRPGRYGGGFENRTRLLRELIAAVRASAPGLGIGVRLSVYDSVPFISDPDTGTGVPAQHSVPYTWGFGIDPENPTEGDLSEARCVLKLLRDLGVRLVNVSAGSPYYSAHLQRPALFPPCDAYLPPEDPLAGAARLVLAARDSKAELPEMVIVSTGWSYFQDYIPHFAQAAVRAGWADFIGIGRVMLSYPELPADVLERAHLDRKKLCRTFSDCTNGPRTGLISGCYPLDPFYKGRPEAAELKSFKKEWTRR